MKRKQSIGARIRKLLQKLIKSNAWEIDEIEATMIEQKQKNMQKQQISRNIKENEFYFKNILDKSSDIVFRNFQVGEDQAGLLIFIDGLIDIQVVNTDILKPLIQYGSHLNQEKALLENSIKEILQNQVITTAHLSEGKTNIEVLKNILSGNVVILIDGMRQAIFASLPAWDKRSVEEPQVEPVLRGPREGFTESLRTNTSMVRRRLRTSTLKMELIKIGRLSQTDVVITYLTGICDEGIIEEVRRRILRIDIDAILDSGYIEEFIEDDPSSIFPQLAHTERPDKLVSSLLEGQVGIMVDNTPFALIAPQTFFRMMQAPDDYYERSLGMSFIRLLRYTFLFIALLMPAIYIALSTFHQSMIPTGLLLTMAASRENIPFPAFIEAMIMEIFFEALREAGIRMPRPVGQTMSIVGALVIGQAAIQAGIVSAPMVITVSITGIASFTVPMFNQAIAIRGLRFVLMILAGTLGLYGVFMGVLVILIHMASLRSLGVPYLSPLAPFELSSLKDVFVRVPWWAMMTRPGFTGSEDIKRMKESLRPRPPK